jgi:hypothetical protein
MRVSADRDWAEAGHLTGKTRIAEYKHSGLSLNASKPQVVVKGVLPKSERQEKTIPIFPE